MQIMIPVAKCNRAIQVETDRLIDNESDRAQFAEIMTRSPKLAYPFVYGLTQTLNDAHANEPNVEKAYALAEKKLARVYDGSVQVRGSGGRKGDPIARECAKRAQARWDKLGVGAQNAAIGKARAKPAFAESDDATIVAAILAAFAKLPEIVEAATKEVESRRKANAAANAVEFDVDALLPDESNNENLGEMTSEEIDANILAERAKSE